jgi:hypothetical protein|tara:strand:- start:3690 stop:4166 length:477 start_codon:yes stop_codon:yes gene_type:complete
MRSKTTKVSHSIISAEIKDEFEPMIQGFLSQVAPDVVNLLERELLQPITSEARKRWPVGDYDRERTSRRGGVSKRALRYVITSDGRSIFARIENNARYKGYLYAYVIFIRGSAEFRGGRKRTKGKNVWQLFVRKPFIREAKKIEGKLLRLINKDLGGN